MRDPVALPDDALVIRPCCALVPDQQGRLARSEIIWAADLHANTDVSLVAWIAGQPGRASLYKDIRFDYRHEVANMIRCIERRPQNASLVQHVFLNGDGAHASGIVDLLRQLTGLRTITYFDFELYDPVQQTQLSTAIPLTSLEHVFFMVLPVDFFTEALRHICRAIRLLSVSRVVLDTAYGWEDPSVWSFPRLQDIELLHTGGMSAEMFQSLIGAQSGQLRTLTIASEKSHNIGTDIVLWLGCTFTNLDSLTLEHFYLDVAIYILQESPNLRKLALKAIKAAGNDSQFVIPGTSWSPTADGTTLLSSIPSRVEQLDILDIRDELLCICLCGLLAEDLTWLPKLNRVPRLSILSSVLPAEHIQQCRTACLNGARNRGIRFSAEDEKDCLRMLATWVPPPLFNPALAAAAEADPPQAAEAGTALPLVH